MPKPRYHAAVSLGLATVVVARTGRWRDAVPVLVAGVLVDVDHLVDLVVHRLRAQGPPGHVILPLHAWEWVFALLARRTRTTDGLAGGLAVHLALDQANRAVRHPCFYWLAVRAVHRFRAREPLLHRDRFERGARWMWRGPHEWV